MRRRNVLKTTWCILTLSLSIVLLNCSKIKDTEAIDKLMNNFDNIAVSGDLALSDLGFNLADETPETYTLVATTLDNRYKGTFDKTGPYSIDIPKGVPFSLTLFDGSGSPECTWLFKIGEEISGSVQLSGNINLGQSSCIDGQVEIPSHVITERIPKKFKEQLRKGVLSKGVKDALFSSDGLSVIPIGKNGKNKDRGNQPNCDGPNCGGSHQPNCDEPDCNGPEHFVDNIFNGGKPAILCEQAGYTVPAFFKGEQKFNFKDQNTLKNTGPTIYFLENTDSDGKISYDMIVEEQNRENQELTQEVFPNMKITGFGRNFAFHGRSDINANNLKTDIAARIIGEIINQTRGEYAPPSFHAKSDPWRCDPLNLANRIRTEMLHRAPLNFNNSNNAIMTHLDCPECGSANFQWEYKSENSEKPLCSVSEEEDSSPTAGYLKLTDFCPVNSSGNPDLAFSNITNDLARTSARVICNAYHGGAKYEYNAPIVDENAVQSRVCVRRGANIWGNYRVQTLTNVTTKEACWKVSRSYTSWEADNWKWRPGHALLAQEEPMWKSCKNLRNDGIELWSCQWLEDQDSSTQSNSNSFWPDIWDKALTAVDGIIEQSKLKHENQSNSSINNTDWIAKEIGECSENMAVSLSSLEKRKQKYSLLMKAIESIENSKDSNGKNLYITTEEKKFKKRGDFSITSGKIVRLKNIMKKYELRLDRWNNILKDIQEVYGTLQTVAVKASGDTPCLAEEIETNEKFTMLLDKFNFAWNGDASLEVSENGDDSLTYGLATIQKKVFAHTYCQEMDPNIKNIEHFGMSAPVVGKVGAVQADIRESFLTEKSGSRTGEEIACYIPSSGQQYITSRDLINKVTLKPGCENIVEKVTAVGHLNGQTYEENTPFGSVKVPKGGLLANVLLMTSRPKANDGTECTITIKKPLVDSNGCWVYKYNSSAGTDGDSNPHESSPKDGQIYADQYRTAENLADAHAKVMALNVLSKDEVFYTLQFESNKVRMQDISKREKLKIVLIPNSALKQAKDAGLDDFEAALENLFNE